MNYYYFIPALIFLPPICTFVNQWDKFPFRFMFAHSLSWKSDNIPYMFCLSIIPKVYDLLSEEDRELMGLDIHKLIQTRLQKAVDIHNNSLK